MKALLNLERIIYSQDVLSKLLSLYESKGKSFYYDDLFSRDQQSFSKHVIEANSYYLGKIFNIDMTDARMKLMAKKKLLPKNKEEHLFNNLKTAITQLQKDPNAFELLVNEVSNLAKLVSKNLTPIGYKTYEAKEEGLLLKSKRLSKREDLEKLFDTYQKQLKSQKYERIQLMSNFYVDFINMDIFTERNDIIGLFLIYGLLAQQFSALHYISFFECFYPLKDAWQMALIQASYQWSSGYAQVETLTRMVVSLLLSSYEAIDQIAHEYVFERELNKSDNIENTILKSPELFTKEDIRKKHPNVSDTTIDRTLKRLKEENKIRPLGKGRSSKWQRIVKGNHKFSHEQLKLFDD